MFCPDCPDSEMDREDKVSEELPLAGTASSTIKIKAARAWGSEYFCPTCHESWYYDSTGFRATGTSTGPARDVINSYANGYVDENGQVW